MGVCARAHLSYENENVLACTCTGVYPIAWACNCVHTRVRVYSTGGGGWGKLWELHTEYDGKLCHSMILHMIYSRRLENDDDSDGRSGCETPRHRRRLPHSASNDEERSRRENAYDYELRFVGTCNTTTDIKEANYFGNEGKFIVAGSDCGCMLLWEKSTTNLIEAWQGDESIVNCLQPHPSSCLVATSGIDPVVRLWSPRSTEGNTDSRAKEVEVLVRSNQKRMHTDPLEEMLRTMGYRTNLVDLTSDDEEEDPTAMQCRTS